MKMKLVIDEKNDGNDYVEVNRKVRIKKEERNLRFLMYFIQE